MYRLTTALRCTELGARLPCTAVVPVHLCMAPKHPSTKAVEHRTLAVGRRRCTMAAEPPCTVPGTRRHPTLPHVQSWKTTSWRNRPPHPRISQRPQATRHPRRHRAPTRHRPLACMARTTATRLTKPALRPRDTRHHRAQQDTSLRQAQWLSRPAHRLLQLMVAIAL